MVSLQVTAQQRNNFGIEFGFVKQNTSQKLEEMATNVLRIVNHTRSAQQLQINLSIPDGWELFGNPAKEIQLMPLDSIFVPVRVVPPKVSKGNTNYLVNGFL